MTGLVQVSTANETREQAVLLAESAVRGRLAAGAQVVGPVVSVFWHRGEFGTGKEWQLLLKTSLERYPALESHLLEHHPWDKPEVVAVPIAAGSEAYLRWVADATSHRRYRVLTPTGGRRTALRCDPRVTPGHRSGQLPTWPTARRWELAARSSG